MKIQWNSTDVSPLKNNSHFEYFTEVIEAFEAAAGVKLKIAVLYALFKTAFETEDFVHKKIPKSDFTKEIKIADRNRDKTFRGLVFTFQGLLHHHDPDYVLAAGRLTIILETYGNVSKISLYDETGAITNLVQELYNKHTNDLAALKLTDWIDRLSYENEAFRYLVMKRYEEKAGKTRLTMKECRAATEKAYANLVEYINSLIVIEGETEYLALVGVLNQITDKFSRLLAQRKGRVKAKKGEEKEEVNPIPTP